jgi:hypothetical protein
VVLPLVIHHDGIAAIKVLAKPEKCVMVRVPKTPASYQPQGVG